MDGSRPNRIYIIGAGFAGKTIAREIHQKGILGRVVAFLDDDPGKIGSTWEGIPVLGPIAAVVNLLRQTPADEALIAIPTAPRERIREIYCRLKRAGFTKIRILPTISQIMEEEAHLIQAREVDPQDFLSRSQVTIGLRESLAYLRGKRVLITGAGGSIGGELARQLLSGGASRLYLFGHGENSIYEIDRELKILQEEGVGERATVIPIVGELQDADYMRFILSRLKADVVFHTAAYKHVPMTEENPVEAVKNNVFGTKHLVDAAREAEVPRFVLISTDKAVDPVSVYGATKYLSERIVLAANGTGNAYMVVRFGNVLGSRGSILPLFRRQILKGGPVTVTDPAAMRYFMTIPEAASLVLKAGGVGMGGAVYTLDMGEPILIRDLADQMIRFFGFEPDTEIPIHYIGLRPGEKLTERLAGAAEQTAPTEHDRINQVASTNGHHLSLTESLRQLKPICFFDPEAPDVYRNRIRLREALSRCVPTLRVPANERQY
jgi:FlaA1/EpsC-like NDP-sugar epimerase